MKEVALTIKIDGSVQESNLEQYKDYWLKQIKSVNTDLVTDNDFATAEKQVKQFKTAEEKLDLAKHYCLEQNVDISALFEMLDDVSGKLRETRLDLNRKVEEKKKSRKAAIIKSGSDAVIEFMACQHAAVKQMEIDHRVFADVAKGKRNLESMQGSVDNAAAELIANIQRTADLVENNLAVFEFITAGHSSLFHDRDKLLLKPESDLVATVEGRIAKAELETRERVEREAREEKAQKDAADAAKKSMEDEQKGTKAHAPVTKYLPVKDDKKQEEAITSPCFDRLPGQVVKSPPTEAERYITTVIITGTKEQALEIGKAVDESVKPFYDVIESVNLTRESDQKSA